MARRQVFLGRWVAKVWLRGGVCCPLRVCGSGVAAQAGRALVAPKGLSLFSGVLYRGHWIVFGGYGAVDGWAVEHTPLLETFLHWVTLLLKRTGPPNSAERPQRGRSELCNEIQNRLILSGIAEAWRLSIF